MAVTVYVSQARDLAAKGIAFRFGGKREEQAAILSRKDVSLARAGSAGDDVRNTVGVGVPGRFDAQPKLVTGLARLGPNELPGAARVDVYASRSSSVHLQVGSRRGDVVHAVAVHIPDVSSDPSEGAALGLANPLLKDAGLLDERLAKIFRLREQFFETGIFLKALEIGIDLDLGHVDPSRLLRLSQPLEGFVFVIFQGVGARCVVHGVGRGIGKLGCLEVSGQGPIHESHRVIGHS